MAKLRRELGKGPDEVLDEAFEEERKWVEARLGGVVDMNGGDEAAADVGKGKGKEKADDDEEEELPEGEGIECQCCFAEYRFVSLTSYSMTASDRPFLRIKWFNAPKPISFARLASPNTQRLNSVHRPRRSSVCIPPTVVPRSLFPSFNAFSTPSSWPSMSASNSGARLKRLVLRAWRNVHSASSSALSRRVWRRRSYSGVEMTMVIVVL